MAKKYAKGFYQSKEWKKARRQCITRANGLCERCRAAGKLVPGFIVHHKEYINPANIHDARVTLDVSNMEYLCEDCHNKEHKTKPNGRYKIDAHGNILPPDADAAAHPPAHANEGDAVEPREAHPKNSAGSHAYKGGQ